MRNFSQSFIFTKSYKIWLVLINFVKKWPKIHKIGPLWKLWFAETDFLFNFQPLWVKSKWNLVESVVIKGRLIVNLSKSDTMVQISQKFHQIFHQNDQFLINIWSKKDAYFVLKLSQDLSPLFGVAPEAKKLS
jgi:hypothetical protein